MLGHDLWPASAALRWQAPCTPFWMTCRTDRHWLCRATRVPKCVQRPSNDCSSPETYTSSPARMMTSNVPWWSNSRGRCRAWFIATWRPAGPGILWMLCLPALLCTYNSTHHSDIGMAPRAMNRAIAELQAQPWQPDFTQGLYAETYHALLKSAGMYRGRNTHAQVEMQEGHEMRTQESQGAPPRQWTWTHGYWPCHHKAPST